MSRAITDSKWRNFIPTAPNLEIEAFRGQPVEIDLLPFMMQGARDLDTGEKNQAVLDGISNQRGWLHRYFNISRPSHGLVTNSLFATGFRYTSSPLYIGSDCFSYVMNNGTQNSSPGTINITVKNFFAGRIIVEEDTTQRTANSRAYRFIGQWYIPPEFNNYSIIQFTWYEHKPVKFFRGNTPYVKVVKTKVDQTRVGANGINGYQYYDYRNNNRFYVSGEDNSVDKARVYPSNGFRTFTWPDPLFQGTIDDSSGLPYAQPLAPFPVSLEISFRNYEIRSTSGGFRRYFPRWTDIENIEVDVRSLYGRDWWRTGNIIDTEDPNFVPTESGTFEPPVIVEEEEGNTFVADTSVIAGGRSHNLALKQDGSVVAWGLDNNNQVSNVPTGTDFIDIAAGAIHSVALKQDGSIVAWGADTDNQVSGAPTGADFIAVACGKYHSMALKQDQSIVEWGKALSSSTPQGNDFTAISAGANHSVALKEDGSIVAWGNDDYSQVSNVPNGVGFIAIASGDNHCVAIRPDGSLSAWGRDDNGQVSNVPSGSNFVDIAAGADYSSALKDDSGMVTWGKDDKGQVSEAPVGTGLVAIAAGDSHGFAMVSTIASIISWGNDEDGQVSSTPSNSDFMLP